MHLCLLLTVFGGLCLGQALGNYRVVGWKTEKYDIQNTRLLGIIHRYGVRSRDASWISWGGHYCWVPEVQSLGYCRLMLRVTEATTGEHYQILGGRTKYYDEHRRLTNGETTWGSTEGVEKNVTQGRVKKADGWVKGWGYAYMSFYVKKSTEPSLMQAFARKDMKDGERNHAHSPVVFGDTKGGEKVVISEFGTWTIDFGISSIAQYIIYISPTTLNHFEPQTDLKVLIKSNGGPNAQHFKERVTINDGCGHDYIVGQTGSLAIAQTISITTIVAYSQTFEFGFSVSVEAGFEIGIVSSTISVSADFRYTTSVDFSLSKTDTESYEYKWPSYCKPGYRCKTTLYISTLYYKVPILFTFKRGGETFTKTNTMMTFIQSWQDKIWRPESLGTPSC